MMNEINVELLDEAPKNENRMDDERFRLLVENMRRDGCDQPILVRASAGGRYEIIDGHHRVRAAKELGLGAVPAVVKQASDAAASAKRLSMNQLRGSLDLASVAGTLADLSALGWSPVDLEHTGFTQAEVGDMLALAKQTGDEAPLGGVMDDAGESDAAPKPFSIELFFSEKADCDRAKRALKRAADGGELSDGLLALIGEDE